MKKEIKDYILCISGGIIYAFGISFFVFPMGLFIGNITGIAQIINDIVRSLTHTEGISTGIILLFLNLPLMFLSYRVINRKFFIKTVITVIAQSVAMASFPVMDKPLFNDPLTLCIIGGVIAGFGSGFSLRHGGCGGGLDILGVYISLKKKNFSVGKVSLFVSFAVFLFAIMKYNVQIFAYSIIFTLIYTFVLDNSHFQNVKIASLIVTKKPEIGRYINNTVKRGITVWKGKGVYSENENYIILAVLNKYEFLNLKKILEKMDPEIFMIDWGGTNVTGNFKTQLFD